MCRLCLLMWVFMALPAATLAQGAHLPAGHPDFYPSADRPIGWRGDGTGAWPGATPTRQWNAATGQNIVWKTAMPGVSFSQPIVVGDKVFTLADPNWLICLSAIDGSVLWRKQVDHTVAMPPDVAALAKQAEAFWDERFRDYAIWLDLERGYKTQIPKERIDQALAAAERHGFSVNSPGQANFNMIAKGDELRQRCDKDQSAYSLYYFGHWEGILTQTFATPVSDGRHLFVSMSNDQVACYDLQGNCQWLVWDRPKQARPADEHVRYAMSPLLVGDKLIVAACGELRAYDKATGRKLWSVYDKKDFGAYWVTVGTPVVMPLTINGKIEPVVLSPGTGVYRASDGKHLGSLPPLPGYEGATAITDGVTHVRKSAPDSGDGIRLGGRLKVVDVDHVSFEETWRIAAKSKSGNLTDVLHNGTIYSPADGMKIGITDGRRDTLPSSKSRYSAPALAGDLLICLGSGGYGFREKNPGVMGATVIDLPSGTKAAEFASAFIDRRYEEDQEFRLRWRWRGNGDAMSNSSPIFQANRMFFRTAGYLWCVGDPSQPWQSPASAPAAARIASTNSP